MGILDAEALVAGDFLQSQPDFLDIAIGNPGVGIMPFFKIDVIADHVVDESRRIEILIGNDVPDHVESGGEYGFGHGDNDSVVSGRESKL